MISKETNQISRRVFISAALGAAIPLLVGCGGSENSAATPTTAVTPTPGGNLFTEAMKPWINEAQRKRDSWARTDPNYFSRVNKLLNTNRLNFIIMGFGEEHGDTYADFGGSVSIATLDLKAMKAGSVSLSRDIYVPELRGKLVGKPETMRYVYKAGGFAMLGKVVEEATGLAADYQMIMRDTVLGDLVNKITGPLAVNVPHDHDAGPFRYGGRDLPGRFIHAGPQVMDSDAVINFVLAEDKNPQGKVNERSFRKNLIYGAVLDKVRTQTRDVGFWKSLYDFMEQQRQIGAIAFDFDLALGKNSADSFLNLFGSFFSNRGGSMIIPTMDVNQQLVINNPFLGDDKSGVSRVHEIKNRIEGRDNSINPSTGRPDSPAAIAFSKKYPDWVLIPDGDADSKDLVLNYWTSLRNHINDSLAPSIAKG